MKHEKLKFLRKQKGLSQKEMAIILSTDISSYCRKENGKSKIHHEEWEKLARALEVSVDEIKQDVLGIVQYDDFTFNIHTGKYNYPNYKIPDPVLQNLYDYIQLLKEQNESLKIELENLKHK